MKFAIRCVCAAGLLLGGVALGRADEPAVELKSVKLDGLTDAIAKHKGKVVVVDFWATFCVPCKAEFPNLVKMHQALGRDGVVAISETIDDTDDKAAPPKSPRGKKATIQNFLLDEPAEVYQKKFDIGPVPAVLVYGRDGKLAKKFNAVDKETAFTYKDVRNLVESLISSK